MKTKLSNSGGISAIVYDITKQLDCPHIHNETLYSSIAGRDVQQSVGRGRVSLENSERKRSLICVNNVLP